METVWPCALSWDGLDEMCLFHDVDSMAHPRRVQQWLRSDVFVVVIHC